MRYLLFVSIRFAITVSTTRRCVAPIAGLAAHGINPATLLARHRGSVVALLAACSVLAPARADCQDRPLDPRRPEADSSAPETTLDSRVRLDWSHVRASGAEHGFITEGTLTNTSDDVLVEPITLVLTSLTSGVTLTNASGHTPAGQPFISVPLPGGVLPPRERVTDIVLRFHDSGAAGVRFTTSVRGGVAAADYVLDTRGELMGVAVGPDGTVYASDAKHGEVFRISPAAEATVIATGLAHPAGLAVDGEDLLIAEERSGRILRYTPSGSMTVVASGLGTPRWLAVAPDGGIYITAHRVLGSDESDAEEGQVIVRRDPRTTQLAVVASDVQDLGGLALNGTGLFAAARRVQPLPQARGTVVRYPVLADGRLGPPRSVLSTGLAEPAGLALDRLGALYVTTRSLRTGETTVSRAIGKAHPDGRLTVFAAALADPRGVALGPDGSLYVADGRSGRLARFRAPPAAGLGGLPRFTDQSPLTVRGTTVPGARVDVFVNDATAPVSGSSDLAGDFTLMVSPVPNAANTLEVFTTARLGDGLTAAPTEATVVHDSRAPSVTFVTPAANATVRETVGVQARVTDGGGSDIATVVLTEGGQALPASVAPSLPAPTVTATASWPTARLTDGTHTLVVTATDRAGHVGSATRVVIVDNTPPDTQIISGPGGEIAAATATFTFAGTDNLTPAPSLRFAWRVDGGAWSAFTTDTTATVSDLSAGPHRFELTARDLAANEDPTPASRTFTVNRSAIRITSPSVGETIPAGMALVRGSVEAGGTEVGVSVNGVPAAVHGNTFVAMVEVAPGPAVLTAVATTGSGTTATHDVAVTVSPAATPVVLTPSPRSGVAPLSVAFSVTASEAPATIELDLDGDGTVDFRGASLDGQRFVYGRPGLYTAAATIIDAQGNRAQTHAVVQVFDRPGLDALLQAKWNSLRDSLRRGDVTGAVALFAQTSQEPYREQLAALAGVGALTRVASDLAPISLVDVMEDAAEYEFRAIRQAIEYSFCVLFVVDADGVWRLWAF